MSRKIQNFMRDVEAEARREGRKAVAELAGFDAHFRRAGQLIALTKTRGLTQRQISVKAGTRRVRSAASRRPTRTRG